MHTQFMIATLLAFNFAASASDSIVCISMSNVTADGSLPGSIRDAFDDDDGRPLKSVSVDLDGDGTAEKFVPNEFLCGNGDDYPDVVVGGACQVFRITSGCRNLGLH